MDKEIFYWFDSIVYVPFPTQLQSFSLWSCCFYHDTAIRKHRQLYYFVHWQYFWKVFCWRPHGQFQYRQSLLGSLRVSIHLNRTYDRTNRINCRFLFAWFAGILIYSRCDTWFSLCIEQPVYISHIITPVGGGSIGSLSNGPSTSNLKSVIHLPRPPRGSIVSSRIHGHCRWHLEITDSEYTDGDETAEEWTD